jgi:outer membrane protein, heavy metal efflux system
MQMIPTAGQARLNGRIARQSTAIAESVADEAWWDVRARTAMQFYDIYQADRQLVVMEETLDWLRQFADIAATMYSSDPARRAMCCAPASRSRAWRRMSPACAPCAPVAAARLNALLDRPAATPIAIPRLFTPVPACCRGSTCSLDMGGQSRPMLERGRLALEQARTQETLARREIWPDLSVGVQYGQRGSDMGTERMGSLMLGFTVPVFAGRRQLQMRTEAAAMTQMAEADLRDMRAQVDARIGELHAELDRARTLIDLYRTEVLPQAEANVTSALASYRVGAWTS